MGWGGYSGVEMGCGWVGAECCCWVDGVMG